MNKLARFLSKDTCCCNGSLPDPAVEPGLSEGHLRRGLRLRWEFDTMDRWFAWMLVVNGVTLIVTQSFLFRPVRNAFASDATRELLKASDKPGEVSLGAWKRTGFYIWKLLCCPMCFGFWVGVLLTLLGLGLPGLETVHLPTWLPWWGGHLWPWWLVAWASGAAASVACWGVHLVLSKLNETLGF